MSFPAGVCDRGPRPLHKGVLSGHGDNRACRLFAVFEGHREEEEEEAVMKPDLEKTRDFYPIRLPFEEPESEDIKL